MTGDAPRLRCSPTPGAVLRLTKQRSRTADAAQHYDGEQFAALVPLIGLIKTRDRLCVITRAARRRLPARPVRITKIPV